MLLALILLIRLGMLFGASPQILISSFTEVPQLPELADGVITTTGQRTTFDFRSWVPVSDSGRVSPVPVRDKLHLVKHKPIEKIPFTYSTSGHSIDLRTDRRFRVLRQKPTGLIGGGEEKQYAIEFDVSDLQIDTEFEVNIEATYWNGFRNATQYEFSTYADDTNAKNCPIELEGLYNSTNFPSSFAVVKKAYGDAPWEVLDPGSYLIDTDRSKFKILLTITKFDSKTVYGIQVGKPK